RSTGRLDFAQGCLSIQDKWLIRSAGLSNSSIFASAAASGVVNSGVPQAGIEQPVADTGLIAGAPPESLNARNANAAPKAMRARIAPAPALFMNYSPSMRIYIGEEMYTATCGFAAYFHTNSVFEPRLLHCARSRSSICALFLSSAS